MLPSTLHTINDALDHLGDRLGVDIPAFDVDEHATDAPASSPGTLRTATADDGWFDVDVTVTFDPGTNRIGDEVLTLRLTVTAFGWTAIDWRTKAGSADLLDIVRSVF